MKDFSTLFQSTHIYENKYSLPPPSASSLARLSEGRSNRLGALPLPLPSPLLAPLAVRAGAASLAATAISLFKEHQRKVKHEQYQGDVLKKNARKRVGELGLQQSY